MYSAASEAYVHYVTHALFKGLPFAPIAVFHASHMVNARDGRTKTYGIVEAATGFARQNLIAIDDSEANYVGEEFIQVERWYRFNTDDNELWRVKDFLK